MSIEETLKLLERRVTRLEQQITMRSTKSQAEITEDIRISVDDVRADFIGAYQLEKDGHNRVFRWLTDRASFSIPVSNREDGLASVSVIIANPKCCDLSKSVMIQNDLSVSTSYLEGIEGLIIIRSQLQVTGGRLIFDIVGLEIEALSDKLSDDERSLSVMLYSLEVSSLN